MPSASSTASRNCHQNDYSKMFPHFFRTISLLSLLARSTKMWSQPAFVTSVKASRMTRHSLAPSVTLLSAFAQVLLSSRNISPCFCALCKFCFNLKNSIAIFFLVGSSPECLKGVDPVSLCSHSPLLVLPLFPSVLILSYLYTYPCASLD